MSYNLKDHINEWVNIELSIDNTNNQAEIFINGSKKDTITYDKKLTKNSQSKLHFGSRADRSKGFRGKLESINISNSKTNETISSAKYTQLKGNSKKQMFNMDFKNTSTSSRKVSERSKYKSSAKFNKPDGETGATLVTDGGKDAVNFSSGDFMEIDAGASMNGELLKNSTFTSWVKLPPTHSKSGYEPIISRENVFSFGINNGHASLFLSQNNQLAPGANITKTEQALAVVDETFAKATFGQNDSIVKVKKNGSLVNNVIESDMIEYSGVANSKALKLTTNDKVEIDKLAYTGRDLSKFSMSMWMKPDILTDNMVLFSRPEMGLALKANSSGKLSFQYNLPISLTFSDGWTSGTTYIDEGGFIPDTFTSYALPTFTLNNGIIKTSTFDNSIVDFNIPGKYTITYSIQDTVGRELNVQRDYIVIDKTPPVITFSDRWVLGDANTSIKIGDSYTLPTVTVTDELGETIIPTITGPETIGTSTVGEYVKTYTATDSAGNTKTITRTFIVNRAPYVIKTIPNTTETTNEIISSFETLVNYFGDEDGDTLTFSIDNPNTSVAQAYITGNTLTIDQKDKVNGTVTFTLTATDPKGAIASFSFVWTRNVFEIILTMPRESGIWNTTLTYHSTSGDNLIYEYPFEGGYNNGISIKYNKITKKWSNHGSNHPKFVNHNGDIVHTGTNSSQYREWYNLYTFTNPVSYR